MMALLKDESFLAELEGRILLFSAFVVLFACFAFAFGGTCAAWQWYVPLALACVSWGRKRLRSAATFLATIGGLWLFAPLCVDWNSGYDTLSYHMPMIRLMSSGWNPFADPEAHGICAKLGLDIWGMRPYHVAYCSKPAAIFCAVAYSFVQDPYAIIYPILFILFSSVLVTSLRIFRNESIAIPILLMVLLWHCLPFDFFVDAALMLASLGLLLTMYADLRDDTFSFVPLAGYGFWMINLKLPGVMAAGIFFMVFTLARLWKHRDRRTLVHFVVLGGVLAMASSFASFNPYGTSLRDKGHPLYPFETVDAVKFPVHNIVGDFKNINEDAAQMGRIGTLVHSYVSPCLASAYYKWKLNRTEFSPHKYTWDYRLHDDPKVVLAPLTWKERVLVMLAVVLMLTIPDLRKFGVGLVILVVAFPFEQIGYMRYQPWIAASGCLACSVFAAALLKRIKGARRVCLWCLLAIAVLLFIQSMNVRLSILSLFDKEIRLMPREIHTCVFMPKSEAQWAAQNILDSRKVQDLKKSHSMNLILRNRQSGIDDEHEVVCVGNDDAWEMRQTALGYFVKKSQTEDTVLPKWQRLLGRVKGVRLIGENYWLRAGRCLGNTH